MCGFLAEFTFDTEDTTEKVHFEALLSLSKHRGPDCTNIVKGQNYQLGFNRLAILDLSEKGNQPMFSPSKRYHLVFNGEIYNYKDLQECYKLTHLQSTSDTEVILHLLDVLGFEATLRELNGMFAIAVVDTQTDHFYLARDFAGIKPLFYGIANNGVVTASQFNQIFNHPWFKGDLKLKPEAVKDYFGFGYMQAPQTIFNTIFQVNPGEYLKIDRAGTVKKHWFKTFNNETLYEAEGHLSVQALHEQLRTAVKRQLISDRPLATFLSGGIDSPLITALAKASKPDIEAFTIGVNHKHMDESGAATDYARHLGITHHIEQVDEDEIFNSVEAHFKAMPEPFGDYSSIPTYLITKKAKQKYTVMLSGDGGDELFFGYPRMLDVIHKRHWFTIPFKIRRPLIRLSNKLGLSNTWAPYHYETIAEWYMEKHTHIFKSELERICPNISFTKTMNTLYHIDSTSNTSLLLGMQHNEFYAHLQRVLIKVDRMSMANSLEVRVPFLDIKILEATLGYLPKRFKSTKDLKLILKKMMELYYPKESITSHKKGFTVPLEEWLNGDLKADVNKVIFDYPIFGAEYLNVDAIKDYVNKFYSGEHQSVWGIWHIYAWQKWAINQGLI